MSKIVIDARELRSSTGRYIERLLHYLQKIDDKNEYTILLKPEDIDTWTPESNNFIKVTCPFKEFTFGEQIGLLRQINKIKPDLVHFGMVQQPIFYRSNVVTTMHDLTTTRFKNPSKNWLIFTIKQLVYKFVNKVVARKSKVIIVPSEFVKDDVAKYAKVNSRKIVVTHEAADPIELNSEPLIELENQKFIFYVGRPMPHKNLYRLISAFSNLKKKNPNLKLVLAGSKDSLYRNLEKWTEEQIINNVMFTGFVSDGQLKWMYENCIAYIFPSLSEGFGLPGLEAMRNGAPVISSNATCLPEIYGDAAVYFDPFDIEDITNKIHEVVTKKELRKRLIKKGHTQVAKYSWSKMAHQTLEIYKEILNQT